MLFPLPTRRVPPSYTEEKPKTRSRRRGTELALATLVLTACSAGDRTARAHVVEDSAGVEIALSRSPLWSEPQRWRLGDRPTVTIGAADDPGHQLFRVVDALRLPDGSIVVSNGGSSELRFYDPDGRHIRSVGGEGRGPGEFIALAGMELGAGGDSLFVFDGALERVTIFDAAGDLLGSFQLEPTGDPIHPLRLYGLGGRAVDGSLVMLARAYPADMKPQPTLHWDSVATLRYDGEGALRDTVGEFAGMDIYATPERAGDIFFGRASSGDVHDGRLYITDGGTYEVRIHDLDGGLARRMRLERERRPVTAADRERLSQVFLARAPDDDVRRMIRQRLDESAWAEYQPWISDLIVDDEGNVWVEEYGHYTDPAPRSWGVFDAEGVYLGSLRLPARFRPLQIGRDFLLGVRRDDLDVEHLEVYELLKPS